MTPPSSNVPSVMRYIIPKGYIAIDGASLTITETDDTAQTFGVMLIQHTQQKITLGKKQVGDKVNIEVDMVGKYVEKSVIAALGGGIGGKEGIASMIRSIVVDVLRGRDVK